MIFILDNYDSFTWNLAQYIGELGGEPTVIRNDAVSVEEVLGSGASGIVVSPGPGVPADAGIAVELVRGAAAAGIPTLGVCLGHQAITEAFGGEVVRATRQMHGKITQLVHSGEGVLAGLPSPTPVMRYHSLISDQSRIPDELEVTGWSADRPEGVEVMSIRHRAAPVWGVQFHPESVGTPDGKAMLRNFLTLVQAAA